MLFSITLAAIYGARYAITEQRMAFNYQMAYQAQQAAEAGLDRGLNSLTWDIVSSGSDTTYNLIDGHYYSYSGNPAKLVAIHSGKFKLLTAGDYTTVEVVGTGIANEAYQAQQAAEAGLDRGLNSLTWDIVSSGSPTVTVSAGAGDGIYANDANLLALSNDGFFENYFSESKDTIRGRATRVDCTTPCSATDAKIQALAGKGGLIWIDGDLDLSSAFAFGSASDPVILVVNGNLTMNDPNAEVYGQLYVAGDWNNGSGGGWVHGTAMVEGNFSANGSLQFDYDAAVLAQTAKQGAYAKVPGSWRDF